MAWSDTTSLEFGGSADGPLSPGEWETYTYSVSGGVTTGSAEATPNTHYSVSGGLGLWAYSRVPTSGDPYVERGVAASPTGVLVGRDARVSARFISPVDLYDRSQDAFDLDISVGLRTKSAGTSYVGARVTSSWTAVGGWVTPATLQAVSDGTVLATATPIALANPMDLWSARLMHELTVELRGSTMTASLDGVVHVSATVGEDGPASPILVARVYKTSGATIQPVAAIGGMTLQSLRDLDRLGSAPDVPGDIHYAEPSLPGSHVVLLTHELLHGERWKRVGGRVYEAVSAHTAEVNGSSSAWSTGDRVIATERVVPGTYIAVTRDLGHARARQTKS